MNNIKSSKSKYGIFSLLVFFFITRTVLMMPVDFLGIETEFPMHYVFSAETAIYWVLLLIFSAASSALILRLYYLHGALPSILGLLILSEPVFFMSQSDPLRLIVSILGVMCVHNAISEKQLIPGKIMTGIFMFMSALLLPYSVFSYCALALGIIIISADKSKKKGAALTVLVSVCCAVLGFILNKIIFTYSDSMAALINNYSFGEGVLKSKSFENSVSFLPFAVLSGVFLSVYLKKSYSASKTGKKAKVKAEKQFMVPDVLLTLYIAGIIGFAFFENEAFCTVNIILLSLLLVLTIIKDSICLSIIDDLMCFVKKHKFITVAIFIAVYYISLAFIDNYYSGEKLIDYIRY